MVKRHHYDLQMQLPLKFIGIYTSLSKSGPIFLLLSLKEKPKTHPIYCKIITLDLSYFYCTCKR